MSPFIKIKKIIFFVLIFTSSFLNSEEKEGPILVRLATETERLPIYLAHIDAKGSGFDADYCSKLENVLGFDLDHNGMTYRLKSSNEREKLAKAASFDQAPQSSDWKAIGAFYVVKLGISNQKAAIRLFSLI